MSPAVDQPARHKVKVLLGSLLLALAAGLSFRQFMLLYTAIPIRPDTLPLMSTAATAVFIGSLGLAVADANPAALGITVATAAFIAFICRTKRPTVPVVSAVVCLLAYVGMRSA